MSIQPGDLLNHINSPTDLKKLERSQLPQLANELRQYIIEHCSVNGGHFAASLGVVELTVALHYIFDTPTDQLVWDVGHQAYGHKILTGRRDRFHTNRKYNGLSGFPKRTESEYDAFGVGHSSTSISAALGMAVASKYKGEEDKQHIAVIGDGAMTGGMAFEALNHAGTANANLLVILNDNNMSIDPNVGALKEYLTDITTNRYYNRVREEVWQLLGKFGEDAQRIGSKMEGGFKTIISKNSNLFESLNFRYFGPIDGHDVVHLSKVLEDLKEIKGPKLLHLVTKKGKGYALAEEDNTKWHAPGLFNSETGEIKKSVPTEPQAPKYQDVFGKTIIEIAKENDKIMGITPAMPSGSSLKYMMAEMPERAFDVGIAEQHAVTFSAGLATQGCIPYCNIYSTFMQRAFDQVLHDTAIQNLHVVFCLDRGGLVGDDGPTHHGAYDYAYMRCIPNMTVMSPMNEEELRDMMYSSSLKENAGPISIRYPRGQGVMPEWQTPIKSIEFGKGLKVKDGEDIAILTIGHVGNFAIDACKQLQEEGINPAHYNLRFVKPIDTAMLEEVFNKFDKVITVENGCLDGGVGSAVAEYMVDNGHTAEVIRLGIPDEFIEHGSPKELYKECGFDAEGIVKTAKQLANITAEVSKV